MDKRLKELKKVQKTTPLVGAKIMQTTAKKLAPRKTGETIRGIRRRKAKNGWTVESWVPGRFKQNLFANQTAPFRTVRYPKGAWAPPRGGKGWTMIAPPGTVAVYGQSPGSWRWSGTPRFWHIASLRMKGKYRKLARKNTQKALRVGL